MNIEQEIRGTGRLPDVMIIPLQPHFPQLGLHTVRLIIGDIWYSTYAYTVARTIKARGMNRPGTPFDLARPEGWAGIGHELWHVVQFGGSLRTTLAYWIGGIARSIPHGSIYEHRFIPFEREAIAFQNQLTLKFTEKPRVFFEAFKAMQASN